MFDAATRYTEKETPEKASPVSLVNCIITSAGEAAVALLAKTYKKYEGKKSDNLFLTPIYSSFFHPYLPPGRAYFLFAFLCNFSSCGYK